MVDTLGNIPGDFMAWSFSQTKPLTNLAKYATSFIDVLNDEDKLMYFLRMEKWISDNPDFAGEACRQWMKDLYQENKLIKGEFEIDDRRVDLANITMPVLNVYADEDHLVPPKTATALGRYVGTRDYKEMALPGGHIGVYVGGRTQKILAPTITEWLRERQ
jgi:polyhydroxyalkanoate synthase